MILMAAGFTPSLPAGYTADNAFVGADNLVTRDNIAADTEDPDFPATNLANPSTASTAKWKAEDTTEQYLTVELSTGDIFDYVAFQGQNFSDAGIAISIEAEVSAVWTEIFAGFIPDNDKPLILHFTEQTAKDGVRVKMLAGDDPAEAGVLYVGKSLRFQRRAYVGVTPFPLGINDEAVTGRSATGSYLGTTVIGEWAQISISLQNLTEAWVRAYLLPFIETAAVSPFFFVQRPGSYPDDVAFAWLSGGRPQPTPHRPNGMLQVQLDFAGVVR